jgi:hypothetical protein
MGIGCVFALAACTRGDPHAWRIEAGTPEAFARWQLMAVDGFRGEEWSEFQSALQEIRLDVMADGAATGREPIEDAMRTRINGLTWRETVVLANQARVRRLMTVRNELKQAVDGNALIVTKRGDAASSGYLDTLTGRQEEQLRRIDADIKAAREKLAALGAARAVNGPAAGDGEVTAHALGRDEAMAQIAAMIQARRTTARLNYGEWPVKIDREGAALTGSDREEFMKSRAAAESNGHTVVAVYVRDRWWIYDAPPDVPRFSAAVMVNLTAADRREIETNWTNVQAEAWARAQADKAPAQR